MTVLAANSTPFEANWKYKTFTLTSGQGIAYQGAAICYRPSTSKCVLAQNAVETDIFMGFSVDKYDATSADVTINVDLIDELRLHWVTNGTSSDAVQATDVGKHCYWLDDQTVSILPTGHTLAGRIWAVDATKGVLVQKSIGGSASFISAQPAVGSYTTNNYAPAAIVNGATYDVPTTGRRFDDHAPRSSAGRHHRLLRGRRHEERPHRSVRRRNRQRESDHRAHRLEAASRRRQQARRQVVRQRLREPVRRGLSHARVNPSSSWISNRACA
jgi:hypothetical protein